MNLAFLNKTLELKVDVAPKIAGKLFDNVVAYAVEKLACPCSAGELRVTG